MPDKVEITTTEDVIRYPRKTVQHNIKDQTIGAKFMHLYGYNTMANAFSVLLEIADRLHDNDPELFRKLLSNNSPN